MFEREMDSIATINQELAYEQEQWETELRPCETCQAELPPTYLLIVDNRDYCSLHVKDAVRTLQAQAPTDGLPF